MADITWQRFVLDRDDGAELYTELAWAGATIYVRSGRNKQEPRIEIHALKNEVAAERGVAKRIATLRKRGYLEDGVVTRPVPESDTRVDRAAERAQRYAEARATFDEQLPVFINNWRELGFDPSLGFVAQCRGTRLHPREVAKQCLTLVAGLFDVAFYERSATFDEEHGSVRPVPPALFVDFYKSPAEVLSIAYGKLRGHSAWNDDAGEIGMADEVLIKIRSSEKKS